ncbi:MAG: OmpH family outer membrane protein [Methanoregulaceae archaeon]|jgi:Skp family chaperone for outer membrane proteins|nr:OmpH family outer membrane protein [Methanoregulaceae archaeon]
MHKTGLAIVALFFGVFAAVGFQDAALKIGIVDISKVVEESDFGKANQATFNQMKTAREGVLEFIDTYRVLTVEQGTRFRDLSIKPNPTAEEKAELDRIKADVQAADKKNKELSVKQNLTPEDRALIEEYSKRANNMEMTAGRWLREFTNELQQWADRQKVISLERARAAIQEVAKAQGFTIVFEVGIAPYGANDLTEAALKAMNAKK